MPSAKGARGPAKQVPARKPTPDPDPAEATQDTQQTETEPVLRRGGHIDRRDGMGWVPEE